MKNVFRFCNGVEMMWSVKKRKFLSGSPIAWLKNKFGLYTQRFGSYFHVFNHFVPDLSKNFDRKELMINFSENTNISIDKQRRYLVN